MRKQEYEPMYMGLIVISFLILVLNMYYFSYPVFRDMGIRHHISDKIILSLREDGIFRSFLSTKIVSLVLLMMGVIVRACMGKDVSWKTIVIPGASGLFLFILPPLFSWPYLFTSLAGYGLVSFSAAMIGRKLNLRRQDLNDVYETFEQCEDIIETDDSINIPTKFQYQHKIHNGWINVVNPFRATMILGTPGSGKSFSVYNPFIEQMIKKGYTMFVYDYKFPDLTEVVYNELLLNIEKYPVQPEFFVINFNDPRYSNRCNPIHPRYITDQAASAEVADIIMKNVNPNTAEKEDFFSMSAKVYVDCLIWFLRIYEGGKCCSFPHLIELMGMPYEIVFDILQQYSEIEVKIRPFANALSSGAQDQLQGQIASAQIPLNKFASPELYWVLSGDDFPLDINNPEHPKVLCVGNNPDYQAIYGTTLALYTSRMFKLINHKGKRPCGVLLDELPTIFIKGLDNLIATARSNKVAIVLGAQDKSQLVRDYTQKEADVIFNTVGNIFAGQVNGKTAEDLSKSFGKEFRQQQSETQGTDSESTNTSYHQEEIMPVSRIETLSQGYFLGKVADNNSTKIARKLFCGEIQIDMERYNEKQKIKKPLPVMTDFNEKEIENSVRKLGDQVIRKDIQNGIMEREHAKCRFPSSEDIKEEVEDLFSKMDDGEKEAILKRVSAERIKEHVDTLVRQNFERIKQEVWNIITTENSKLPKPHDLSN